MLLSTLSKGIQQSKQAFHPFILFFGDCQLQRPILAATTYTGSRTVHLQCFSEYLQQVFWYRKANSMIYSCDIQMICTEMDKSARSFCATPICIFISFLISFWIFKLCILNHAHKFSHTWKWYAVLQKAFISVHIFVPERRGGLTPCKKKIKAQNIYVPVYM